MKTTSIADALFTKAQQKVLTVLFGQPNFSSKSYGTRPIRTV